MPSGEGYFSSMSVSCAGEEDRGAALSGSTVGRLLGKVSGATKVAGVVGSPVTQSLSPTLHNAAFAALELDWAYVAFPLSLEGQGGGAAENAETERVAGVLRAAFSLGVAGLSITMPWKQAACRAAVQHSAAVREIGAANTLVRGEMGWRAANTDATGFVAFLEKDLHIECAGLRVGLLGAGGAATALAYGLGEAGIDLLRVWNRTPEKAHRVVCHVGERGEVLTSPELLRECDIVVSCVPANALPEGLAFTAGQVAIDLAYAPLVTGFLERAATAGAIVHNGLGLLLRQAAEQFSLWTGLPAPLADMRRALEDVAVG